MMDNAFRLQILLIKLVILFGLRKNMSVGRSLHGPKFLQVDHPLISPIDQGIHIFALTVSVEVGEWKILSVHPV